MKYLYLTLFSIFLLVACEPAADPSSETQSTVEVAAVPQEMATTDSMSLILAQKVMEAMGGKENWDNTRYLDWNFFGRRRLLWDKYTGNVRIEIPADTSVYLVNINDNTGKVSIGGNELTEADTLKTLTERGKAIWINDAYWLVMPYKLLDPGVTLTYLGEGKDEEENATERIQLTFDAVGRTPQNKYVVHIDSSSLVSQWEFFSTAADEEPRIVGPWKNYKKYGGILLSGDRGPRQLSDINVYTEVPEEAFTSFAPIDSNKLIPVK